MNDFANIRICAAWQLCIGFTYSVQSKAELYLLHSWFRWREYTKHKIRCALRIQHIQHIFILFMYYALDLKILLFTERWQPTGERVKVSIQKQIEMKRMFDQQHISHHISRNAQRSSHSNWIDKIECKLWSNNEITLNYT